MIFGAHFVIYSKDATADRAFLRDVLDLSAVDGGGGWLIFALPPAEAAIHPSNGETAAEFYLLCDNLQTQIADITTRGGACSEVQEARWGSITKLRLPSGGEIGLYQPKHPLAIQKP